MQKVNEIIYFFWVIESEVTSNNTLDIFSLLETHFVLYFTKNAMQADEGNI